MIEGAEEDTIVYICSVDWLPRLLFASMMLDDIKSPVVVVGAGSGAGCR